MLVAAGFAVGYLWRSVFGEVLLGGVAAGKRPSDFDPDQLARGTHVELEHTIDVRVAQEIAMDHLAEDPNYYTKLDAAGL